MTVPSDRPTTLITDYAGVLTRSPADALTDWMVADGLDRERFPAFMKSVMVRSMHDEDGPVHGLEVGTWSAERFQQTFVAEIEDAGLGTVAPEGLLKRMFGGLHPVPAMMDAVAALHSAGVRTALLSNAFGMDYARDRWSEVFDATVISDEVGLRKPDPAIYLLTCKRLGVDPSAVVYVDDFEVNVAAAVALGMTGIRHVDAATTIAELGDLFGAPSLSTFG